MIHLSLLTLLGTAMAQVHMPPSKIVINVNLFVPEKNNFYFCVQKKRSRLCNLKKEGTWSFSLLF